MGRRAPRSGRTPHTNSTRRNHARPGAGRLGRGREQGGQCGACETHTHGYELCFPFVSSIGRPSYRRKEVRFAWCPSSSQTQSVRPVGIPARSNGAYSAGRLMSDACGQRRGRGGGLPRRRQHPQFHHCHKGSIKYWPAKLSPSAGPGGAAAEQTAPSCARRASQPQQRAHPVSARPAALTLLLNLLNAELFMGSSVGGWNVVLEA